MKRLAICAIFVLLGSPLSVSADFTSKAQIEDYAISRAVLHNVSVTKTIAIISAESNFTVNAKNPSSTASGLAQFIDGSFEWLCMDRYKLTQSLDDKNDPKIQIECLVLTLKDGGDSHWNESKPVWSKIVDAQ